MSKKSSIYTLKPTEAGNVLLTAVQRFFAERKLVDVKISSENVVLLSCHKIILASFSSYFETLLTETEGATVLNMDSISLKHAKHLRSIVNFMYGYSIQVYRKDCACLLEAAKMFGVSALIKSLQSNLDRPNLNSAKSQNELLTLKPTGISSLLLVSFQRFRKENKFIDAKIGFGEDSNQFFLSHKLVLASFSTYFESLLQGTESCAVLGLESVDPLYVRQLETIMDYMYGQVVNLDDQQVEVLRDAAKVFGIYSLEEGELMKLCSKAVKDRQQRLLDQKLSSLRDYSGTKTQMMQTENSSSTSCSNSGVKFVYLSSTGGGASAEDAEVIRKGWKGENLGQDRKQVKMITESSNDGATAAVSNPVTSSLEFSPVSSSNYRGSTAALIGEDVCVAPQCPQNSSLNEKDLLASDASGQPASFVVVDGSSDCRDTYQIGISETTGGKYLCVECGKLFKSTQSLDNHVNAKHSTCRNGRSKVAKGSERICCVDGTKVGEGEEEEPLMTVDGFSELGDYGDEEEFEAGQFQESQVSNGNLDDFCQPTTSRDSSIPNRKILKCPECGFETTALRSMKSHIAEEHNGSVNICHRCCLPLSTRKELNLHLQKYHEAEMFTCTQCGKLFQSKPGLVNHMQVHSKELFNCPECAYMGSTKSNLHLHMRKCHFLSSRGKKLKTQYACAECKQTFPYKSLYTRHFKMSHLKLKSFRCPYDCDYAATEKGALQTHIRCMHTREKPFFCPTCKQGFLTQSHLARHKRTHTGLKPHICGDCGEHFSEKRELRSHLYKMHREDRPFPCPNCDRGFLRKDHLLNHRRKIHAFQD